MLTDAEDRFSALDHPLRGAGVDELHARPFPVLNVPSRAVFLALMPHGGAAALTREAAHEQLVALIGPQPPHAAPRADENHWSGPARGAELKWERHTEFNSFWAFRPGRAAQPFAPEDLAIFPPDWLASASAARIAALHVNVEPMPDTRAELIALSRAWFSAESLAMAEIADGAAVIAGDFRLDPQGQMRFCVFVRPGTGPRRIGRIVQRLCEVECYRAMSMLGLFEARRLNARLDRLDPQLLELVSRLDAMEAACDAAATPRLPGPDAEAALHALLRISAELEQLAVEVSFRFGATGAYAAIVEQRVAILREERVEGRQTFAEFMMRRHDPAMRTTRAAEARLARMSERAQRAAELLRTRVDVERSAQSQQLLASMDRRSDLALRLQHTVEGLSVVAISYYAHGLVKALLYPLAGRLGWSADLLAAGLVLPVMAAVWLGLRRIRKSVH